MATALVDTSLDIKMNDKRPVNPKATAAAEPGRATSSGMISRSGSGTNNIIVGYNNGRSKASGAQVVWRPARKTGDSDTDNDCTPRAETTSPSPEVKEKAIINGNSPVEDDSPQQHAALPCARKFHGRPSADIFVRSKKASISREGNNRKSVLTMISRDGNNRKSVLTQHARPLARDHGTWQHDKFDDSDNVGAIGTGTKVYVSNLDYGVSNDDIKELFSEVGELEHCSINYDRIGRSKGTAEVIYTSKRDAIAAIKRYNNVQLDGKSMKIEAIVPYAGKDKSVRSSGSSKLTYRGGIGVYIAPRRNPVVNMGHGRLSNGIGGGSRGRDRRSTPRKTAEDLDADLENYHAGNM